MSEFPLKINGVVKLCSSRRAGRDKLYWDTPDLIRYYYNYIDTTEPPSTKRELCSVIKNHLDRERRQSSERDGRSLYNRLAHLQDIRLAPEIENVKRSTRFRQKAQIREREAVDRAERLRRLKRMRNTPANAGAGADDFDVSIGDSSPSESSLTGDSYYDPGVSFMELTISPEILMSEDELAEESLQDYDREQASLIKYTANKLPGFPLDRILYIIEKLSPEAPLIELVNLIGGSDNLDNTVALIGRIVKLYPELYPEIIGLAKNLDVLSNLNSAVSIGVLGDGNEDDGDKVLDVVSSFNSGLLTLMGLTAIHRIKNKGRDLTERDLIQISDKLKIKLERLDKKDRDDNYAHPLLKLLFKQKVSFQTMKNVAMMYDVDILEVHTLPQIVLISRLDFNDDQINNLATNMMTHAGVSLDIFKDELFEDAIRYVISEFNNRTGILDVLGLINIFGPDVSYAYLFREIFMRSRDPDTFIMEYFNDMEHLSTMLTNYSNRAEQGENVYDLIFN